MAKKNQQKLKKNTNTLNVFDSDETFAYIVDYTSGGAPYGITWEEWREIEKSELHSPEHKKPLCQEEELPF